MIGNWQTSYIFFFFFEKRSLQLEGKNSGIYKAPIKGNQFSKKVTRVNRIIIEIH